MTKGIRNLGESHQPDLFFLGPGGNYEPSPQFCLSEQKISSSCSGLEKSVQEEFSEISDVDRHMLNIAKEIHPQSYYEQNYYGAWLNSYEAKQKYACVKKYVKGNKLSDNEIKQILGQKLPNGDNAFSSAKFVVGLRKRLIKIVSENEIFNREYKMMCKYTDTDTKNIANLAKIILPSSREEQRGEYTPKIFYENKNQKVKSYIKINGLTQGQVIRYLGSVPLRSGSKSGLVYNFVEGCRKYLTEHGIRNNKEVMNYVIDANMHERYD